ncbi:ATP-grasp domain-containing protein [Undibacterium sp. CY18W]|uniref:ATP-grasp domain-containing protein n=1 Tax=Undibacterium hunanense TaxID=2762292 RepID=A0ABR6ZTB2_9BURK|nr:ATP-grasp domain-containing protein [Undibacterium hunanense]MBC3919137.1 ATP-grasp domain-containing protein [Undibacterium hunanense]
MHWVIQNNIFSETGWDHLLQTIDRFGLAHSVHKVVPFVGELEPPAALDHRNVICIGSYSMRHIAKRSSWEPGVFDLFEQDFEQQLKHWGEHMLNASSVISSFQDAVFTEELMFVRPTNDSKYFAGRVFSRDEFETWQRLVCDLKLEDGSSLTPQTMIQVVKPIVIYCEARFWVIKGSIITKSIYKRGDRVVYSSDVDDRLTSYVEERIKEWQPHDAFVIDVCDTENGLKIVEINTLNSSGFYAGDVQKLVLALEEAFTI